MNEQSAIRRRATNVSLNSALVEEARALGVNLSRACETGLAAELQAERQRRWREENAEAIASSNAWIDANGWVLAKYRRS